MAETKKYVSVLNDGVRDLYIKDAEAREQLANMSNFESDGAIDTLFDTHYDAQTSTIVCGEGCADFDPTTRVLTIEGAVIVKDGVGIIVIS